MKTSRKEYSDRNYTNKEIKEAFSLNQYTLIDFDNPLSYWCEDMITMDKLMFPEGASVKEDIKAFIIYRNFDGNKFTDGPVKMFEETLMINMEAKYISGKALTLYFERSYIPGWNDTDFDEDFLFCRVAGEGCQLLRVRGRKGVDSIFQFSVLTTDDQVIRVIDKNFKYE